MIARLPVLSASLVFALISSNSIAQVTVADYKRAAGLKDRYSDLTINSPGAVHWIGESDRFWYRKSVSGGHEFVLVDANSEAKQPAFDHSKLAAALSQLMGSHYSALRLPFSELDFETDASAIDFRVEKYPVRCSLNDYVCKKVDRGPDTSAPWWTLTPEENAHVSETEQDEDDPPEYRAEAASSQAKPSPDGKWEAQIRSYNLLLHSKSTSLAVPLSWDGSEANYYALRSLSWSPDSTHIVVYRIRPGPKRRVHYIESSPADQLQPKFYSREYTKPGDTLDIATPVLFDVVNRKAVPIDDSLFPNQYGLSNPVWWRDGRAFTFEYNQRGHQIYRLIEVEAHTGRARALITEQSSTFIDYRRLLPNPADTGKRVRVDLGDGKEIIWMSERDGWAHLYLFNGITGELKNQITKGKWVVRAVDYVDEERRQIWFQASGVNAREDPYFVHSYRINFNGSGLTPNTEPAANHQIVFSPDHRYYTDTWSRIDLPPVMVLRSTADRDMHMQLEQADASALLAGGWRPPETFKAMGRDGKTEIWGILSRPAHFDAARKYPVVELIYNGPQGSFVPKSFSAYAQPLTELGFVVVQIDGMGTNNRSKAFHDIAWKNLKDAGLEDRILWHKAAAAKYSWYDITRVGIFGNSAGGQNAMGALLFHPEFYKVAVANSGCHDNRMDKIWWNEQWMGWPVGPEYTASSNVENAWRLRGALLLIVGEMDSNVDPASTLQVVNALIKARKRFDLLFVPDGEHGAGGEYGEHLLEDFFVKHLLNQEPPDWNDRSSESVDGH